MGFESGLAVDCLGPLPAPVCKYALVVVAAGSAATGGSHPLPCSLTLYRSALEPDPVHRIPLPGLFLGVDFENPRLHPPVILSNGYLLHLAERTVLPPIKILIDVLNFIFQFGEVRWLPLMTFGNNRKIILTNLILNILNLLLFIDLPLADKILPTMMWFDLLFLMVYIGDVLVFRS